MVCAGPWGVILPGKIAPCNIARNQISNIKKSDVANFHAISDHFLMEIFNGHFFFNWKLFYVKRRNIHQHVPASKL